MTDRRENFVQCRKCPRLKLGGPKPGYYYDKSESGFDVVKECDCHKKWRIEKELEIKFEIAKVNTKYTFDDYNSPNKEQLEYLKNFANNFEKCARKTMIYLYGPNGTMKTCMSQYTGQVIIRKGYTVQYIMMQDLINDLISIGDSENVQEEKEYALKRYYNVDLLIIDEAFDKDKVSLYKSGFQLPYLDSFLRNRFEMKNKSIFFISNIKPSDIAKYGFGISLQDFVERNTRGSQLFFSDRYVDNAGVMDPNSLFKSLK